MLLIGFLSLFFVGSESFTSDEAYSFFFMRLDLSQVWRLLGDHMPLQYILLKAWGTVFGESDSALRSLSALFSIASVPVFYLLVCRLLDRRTALIGSWLFASKLFRTCPRAERAKLRARHLPLSVLSSYLFVTAVMSGPSPARLSRYALASVLAVYAHAFALWVLTAHGLSLIFLKRDQRPHKELALVYATVAVAITPLLVAA
jgi:mannosyltransferase